MNGRSSALALYRLASWLAGPLARPILARRAGRGKEDAGRMAERLGRPGCRRPGGRLVWLHGASVGEAVSALPLIEAFVHSGVQVLLTSGTVSSARRVADMLPEGAIHQYVPVDTRTAVGRFLDHWRPDLGVWIESELWPEMVHQTAARGIPMAMVNARLSERSHARWQRLPRMARRLLRRFRLILAQDQETVARLRDLGVRSRFAGNLKALVAPPAAGTDDVAKFADLLAKRRVWLAASTHPGEEEIALEAHRRLGGGALLILAPRHPERGDRVAALVTAAGFALSRRSLGEVPGAGSGGDSGVWLTDTLGELGLWYRLAPVSFVGGSLADHGGHTPFEPVSLGSAVVHGPSVTNFAPAYRAFDGARGALEVFSAEGLAAAVERLLSDDAARRTMVARAMAVHAGLRPDVQAIATELLDLLERP